MVCALSEHKLNNIKQEMVNDLLVSKPNAVPIGGRTWDMCFAEFKNYLILWYDQPMTFRGTSSFTSGLIKREVPEWTEN